MERHNTKKTTTNLRLPLHLPRPIPPNPRISPHPLPHPPPQQLINRYPQLPRFQIPQRDIDPRRRTHEHRAPAVEIDPPRFLPDVLDVVRVHQADEAQAELVQHALDGFGVGF